jgi:hypothetical protein
LARWIFKKIDQGKEKHPSDDEYNPQPKYEVHSNDREGVNVGDNARNEATRRQKCKELPNIRG